MLKTNGNGNPARRPWYRLHLSTWLILPAGFAVAALVVLPGGVGQYPEQPSWVTTTPPYMSTSVWDGHRAIVHGWPLTYLWRTPVVFQHNWGGMAPSAPWRLTEAVREFRLAALMADVALMASCLAVFAALVEWRRRRRRRAAQFTLRELLALTTAIAAGLGWWNHERRTDRELSERFEAAFTAGSVPRFPLWARTLVGDFALSRLRINGPDESIDVDWHAERQDAIQFIVERFPNEVAISTGDSIGIDGDSKGIASLRELGHINCGFLEPGDLTRFLESLKRHPSVRELKIWGGPLDSAQSALLAAIPRLDSLTISFNGHEEPQASLQSLKNCPGLKELWVDEAPFTAGGIESLGELEQLTRLNLNGSQWPAGGATALARLTGLEELCLSRTSLGDVEALHLRELPKLRRLSVAHTLMTPAGLCRLLDPSPGAFAGNLEQICISADLIDDELAGTLKRLPRLYLICVTWDSCIVPQPGEHDYHPTVQKLRQALPDRDVIDLQIITGSIL